MVVQLRVDGRLIHGQFVLAWGKELNTPKVVVVDDHAAQDKFIASGLHMAIQAASPDFKLAIKSLEEAKVFLKDPRVDDVRIICVVRDIVTACKVALAVPEKIQTLNVSYSMHKDEKDSVQLSNRLYLSQEEMILLKEVINNTKIEVVNWPLPYSKKENFVELFKAKGIL